MLTNQVQEQLKRLSKESPTSEAIFEALGRRERSRGTTNLRLFKYFLNNSGIQVASDQYINVFAKLEDLGVGTLVRGRKTKSGQLTPARFVWNYNLKDIAKAAIGEKPSQNKIDEYIEKTTKPMPETKAAAKPSTNHISVDRDGLKIEIDLPKDVKPEDLTAWISLIKELEK